MSESSQKSPRPLLTPAENLAVGAFGGAFETCVQMPLLTYKFTVQSGRPLPTSLQGWFRGVTTQAGSVAPITAIQVALNGGLEWGVTRGIRNLTDVEKCGCAMTAGALSSLVYSPVDLITIQQQKLKLSIGESIATIRSQHGWKGLYRGVCATALRESLYTGGYLGFSPVLIGLLQTNVDYLKDKDLASAILGAMATGIVASAATHPVDTAKTRLQADMAKEKWVSLRQAMPKIYKYEGFGALFQGFAARTTRSCGAFFIIGILREQAICYKETKTKSEER